MQTNTERPDVSPERHLAVESAWLGKHSEDVIEPDLAIIDAHHHLWGRSRSPHYSFDDYLQDLNSGHKIVATVFVESRAMYRPYGPAELRSVGEVEFANGIAAMSASGEYGRARACAGIVASMDLQAGAKAESIIRAHEAAGGGRLRGFRQISAYSDHPDIRVSGPVPPANLLSDPEFREGFRLLARTDLSFDAWVYHPQLAEVADLANAFPDTLIVLNHTGGPIGIGPYASRRSEGFVEWRQGIRRVAQCSNVAIKLGGLGMKLGGFRFNEKKKPPSSQELAFAWRPYLETCIEAFSTERCMFESNFPVEKGSCAYATLWNAFKRIAAGFSADEKRNLFFESARRIYRLADSSC